MMRVRLTEDEAKRGVSPEPFSREEWRAMADASREYAVELRERADIDRFARRFREFFPAYT